MHLGEVSTTYVAFCMSCIIPGHRYYLDTLLVRKISKRRFLKDIENSFQEVTQIGPEPPHFFFFFKYLNK